MIISTVLHSTNSSQRRTRDHDLDWTEKRKSHHFLPNIRSLEYLSRSLFDHRQIIKPNDESFSCIDWSYFELDRCYVIFFREGPDAQLCTSDEQTSVSARNTSGRSGRARALTDQGKVETLAERGGEPFLSRLEDLSETFRALRIECLHESVGRCSH